jgi:regulator of RNase E activity RraA
VSGFELPVRGHRPPRVAADVVEAFSEISTATATGALFELGVRNVFIRGASARRNGAHVAGTAVTLQFMPRREDVIAQVEQEEAEKRSALWAVLETIEPGDVLVVQAFADPNTGCLGEMLLTALRGHGGRGVVVDGCVRDWPKIAKLDLPIWSVGVTPNFASQALLFPWGYDVPVACGGALVLPGDVIVADDDGAVVVPASLAEEVRRLAEDRDGWEEFSRLRLSEGGELKRYYPLSDEARPEFEEWRRRRD